MVFVHAAEAQLYTKGPFSISPQVWFLNTGGLKHGLQDLTMYLHRPTWRINNIMYNSLYAKTLVST